MSYFRPVKLLQPPLILRASKVRAGAMVLVALLWAGLAGAGDVPFRPALPGTSLKDFTTSRVRLTSRLGPPVAPDLVDAGDAYTLPDGRKVNLLRSRTSVAVRFETGVATEKGLGSLKARKDLPEHEVTGRASFGKEGGGLHLLKSHVPGTALDATKIQADASVAYARHVLVDPKTKTRMIPTDEVLARFGETMTPAAIKAVAARAGLEVMGSRLGARIHVVKMRLLHPKATDPLAAAAVLRKEKGVAWAQPNFVREMRHFFTPPNPLFGDQQALQNTGQNFGVPGADVKAPAAWDRTTGKSSLVIAIIDDGVDISHPGLRIFTNPGESGDGKEGNGVDDDGNGFIDDVHGWDFANDDNDVTPVGTNGHGTGTAGIAGATFGSQAQTAGMAQGCTILPVKIADDTGVFTTDDVIGEAILYAAQYADVLSNSWGGGSQSSYIDDAINYAVTQGRQGKGCPVFFATGNYASTWYSGGGRYRLSTATLSGSYYYGFYYRKGQDSGGEDTVRVDNVCLLDADGYTHLTSNLYDEDFESSIDFGDFMYMRSGLWQFLTSDDTIPYWSIGTTNALTGTGGVYSAASPPLMNQGDYSVLVTPPFAVTGVETVAFAGSVSIADDSDFYVLVFDGISGDFLGAYGPWNGAPDTVDPSVAYPASNPQTIAVGAATDCDLRSDYTEYLGHLDFLASSNGGWNDIGTLDPVGDVGWTPQDYKLNFGGTSAATPLAAGIAALMLCQNPALTAEEIRTLMHNTCDKIGGVTYGADGTHPMYGYGRVNAAKAVAAALPYVSVASLTVAEGAAGTTTPAVFTLSLDAATIHDVTVTVSASDGTAIAGTNYTATPAMITIPAGSTSATWQASILGGTLKRPTGTFSVVLSSPVNAAVSGVATCTITPLDTDGDGMPDYWEILNGFDPNDPSDAALDADADGFTNLREFQMGTDPHHVGRFAVGGLQPAPGAAGGGMVISFNTVLGQTYRVEYKNNLNDPTWTALGADITGTGGLVQVTDTVSPGTLPFRFYHVVMQP